MDIWKTKKFGYSGKCLQTLKVLYRVPFRESSERGRVREGEMWYHLRGRPSKPGSHFGIMLAIILTFKNSIEKTVSKREPMGTKMEGQRTPKSTKHLK